MFERTWTDALWLGTWALIVIAASWVGVRARSVIPWMAAVTCLTVLVVVYGVLQHGAGHSRGSFIGGELAAELAALTVLVVCAALPGNLARRAGAQVGVAVLLGVVVGLLVLSQMASIRLRIGCWFTGICP